MNLVSKSTSGSELVPRGFKSWTEYYEWKQSAKRFCDTVIPALAVLTILCAYALVGTLEMM